MNELKIFENPEFGKVRVTDQNGEPWFVAADVCRALDIGNSRQAVARLDDDEKGVISSDTPGGQQMISIVSEPGMYALVLGSRKKEAKQFKRWITHEVLPELRKTGTYSMIPKTYVEALRAYTNEVEKNQKLLEENATQKEIIEANQKKVTYYDTILQSDEALCATQIASDYAISAKKLNIILCAAHIQYKVNGQWILYSEHKGKGYTVSITYPYFKPDGSPSSITKTCWTQAGRLKIHQILSARGIRPRMDLDT